MAQLSRFRQWDDPGDVLPDPDSVRGAMKLPDGVLGMARRGPEWATWVDRLPALVDGLLEEWELGTDGWMMHGFVALVVPVRTTGGRPAVLKVSFPDEESEHEHLALQHWGGRGAVKLLRADPRRSAMLLERLHPERLDDVWDVEACEVVAGLYRLLHRPALPQLRPLSTYADRWAGELAELPRSAPLPRRLVEQAVSLARDFAVDAATTGTLIHGDLHYENVMAADREPWLAIDPKPMSGDPHYELAPMLWNRFEELSAPGSALSVRDGVRQRFHTLVDHAELDEHRARDWVVVRMLTNARERVLDPPEVQRLTSSDDYLTTCIAVAKAVQD
jgi:streptomycin 6-kinase